MRFLSSLAISLFAGCGNQTKDMKTGSEIQKKVNEFVELELSSDSSHLSDNQKEMLGYLFDAATLMEDIYWQEAYGDKEALLSSIEDQAEKEFVKINYGPWERLNGNEPFIEGIGQKPAGANFYPTDMTKEESEALESADKTRSYTIVFTDAHGTLYTIPYHKAFNDETGYAIEWLKNPATLAEDEGSI